MGNDIQKGTTYATGGVGGQGSITSANLNAHVDDAIIKPTLISAKTHRITGQFTDNVLVEAAGVLYCMNFGDIYDLFITPGTVIQTVSATPYTANAAIGNIPIDDTIPQDTEGTQILTLSITPHFNTSKIQLTFNGFGAGDTAATALVAALFRAGNVNALKTTMRSISGNNHYVGIDIDWVDFPGTTAAQTYNLRVGISSGVGRMNGTPAARLFGGSAACTLVAKELCF